MHLGEDNRCAIYDKRPEICNVATMYEKHYKAQYSQEEFYALNAKACGVLKDSYK